MANLKVAGGLVGGILVFLAAVLLAVWLFVNPTYYKGSIVAKVKEVTGRDLALSGDLKLSIFPWVALECGPASLSNLPGFSDAPFLTITHATMRVRLMPLLRRRLEVSRIEVEGLDVHLFKNADGKGNWHGAEPLSGSSASADNPSAERDVESLPEVRVRDARMSYQDLRIEHLDFESGSVGRDHDIPVSATFDANRGTPGEGISVNAKFDVSDNSGGRPLHLAAVNLNGRINRPDDSRPAHWELTAPALELNLAEQSLASGAFSLTYSNAHLTGSILAKNVLDDVSLTGSMTLMPLVLHEFAPRLGLTLPTTQDPKALSQLSGAADVAYASKAWSLTKLQARLDDTQFEGNLSVSGGPIESLTFDLAADQIDIDRYRRASARGSDQSQAPDQLNSGASPVEAAGTLKVASATFLGKELSHLRLTIYSKERLTHFFPLEADVDGGRYSGDITLDERGAVSVLNVNEHLTGVDLSRLLAAAAPKRHLSGRATLNFKGAARGATPEALLKTLNGHLDAELSDGAFEGIDLGYDVNRAQALFDRSTVTRSDTGRTMFDQFKVSAQITNGIADTQDLTISSEALKITGQGSVSLPTKAIHLQLKASLLTAPGTTLVDVPVDVSGTYADPTVKANITAVAKDQLKQKFQDILKKNGLQGLFSK
jgi:AsmA protein